MIYFLFLLFSWIDLSAQNHYEVSEIGFAQGIDFTAANELVAMEFTNSETDLVFNRTSSFRYSSKKTLAEILISTRQGTILAGKRGSNPSEMVQVIDQSAKEAVYTGLTIAKVGRYQYLYAADFSNGFIDIFDSYFKWMHSFTDDDLSAKYAPFNIQHINEKLYIAFATCQGEAHGVIEVFDISSAKLSRLISDGRLHSPRGMAIAPINFGQFSKALLVGNYGDGCINAFDPHDGKFLGRLMDENDQPIMIEGLWDLKFPPYPNRTETPFLIYSTDKGEVGVIKAQW